MNDGDYVHVPGNKMVVDSQNNYGENGLKINLDQIVAEQGDFRKLVFGCQASGSELPFPNCWFDSYVSNLVLQLIDCPENQIREAFRVLKPGSIAAFTVWGRRENSLIFTASEITEQRMRGVNENSEPEQAGVSNFDLGRDFDSKWANVFKEAGFAQVKRWYQPQHHLYRNSTEFMKFPANVAKAQLPEETQQAFRQTYDDISGANTLDLKTFEAMIIVAFKD